MIYRTQKNTIPFVAGTSPLEVLPPNPRRKAIILSPIPAGSNESSTLLVATFLVGAGQTWVVPDRVTDVIDAYTFGGGGNPGASGGGLGGGGGGGGGFAAAGPQTVLGGQVWTIDVPAGGSAGSCVIANNLAATIARAETGANGVADAGGLGGAGGVGAFKVNGGTGEAATALLGAGAGGGAGSGSFAGGTGGAGQVGGTGGGAATHNGIGRGGNGGNGGNAAAAGVNGVFPGGGGGGDGNGNATAIVGADGAAYIFYRPGIGGGAISMDPRSDVAVGQGTLNWISGIVFPLIITDQDIGSAITEPWFIVSSDAARLVQVTEYIYTDPADCLEC